MPWRADHEALEDALGAGGADVVLLHDLEDRGPGHAGGDRGIAVADGERRPDQLRQVVPGIDIDRREGDRRDPVEGVSRNRMISMPSQNDGTARPAIERRG
jgi:hypothetical protein